MKTERITTDLARAAELIRAGQLVAVPTETVYGLAANALNERAVRKIYEVKGRPAVKPLSIMISGRGAMEKYCDPVPPQAALLADKLWPGPLTIVLTARGVIPDIVRAGGATVGLRCPDHALTLKAIHLAGVPLAAPSANPSGADSPKNADTVLEYFDGKISAVIDGGECGIGRESTLIDMSTAPYKILRQGALSEDEIADALISGMTVVGLTGGTGTGKTTALDTLADMGALTLDCDAIYHCLLRTDSGLIAAIGAAFPAAVIDGAVDTKALGRIVFADTEALSRLNALTHEFILAETRRLLRAHAMNGGTLAAIDAVELISSGAGAMCDFTVGIVAERERRIDRICARDGISREYAALRLDAQRPDEYYYDNCDFVLHNDGTKAEFAAECIKLFTEEMKNE